MPGGVCFEDALLIDGMIGFTHKQSGIWIDIQEV
jgi:hypothetical protein